MQYAKGDHIGMPFKQFLLPFTIILNGAVEKVGGWGCASTFQQPHG
jgi:hypothetical protein